jgi:hypothetical protein
MSLWTVNNLDWNKRRFAQETCLLAMLAEPTMNGIKRATNVASDLPDGLLGFKNECEGSLANLGTVRTTHEKLNEK